MTRRRDIGVVIFVLGLWLASGHDGFAQCSPELASEAYLDGSIEVALTNLRRCDIDTLVVKRRTEALRVMALSYVATDSLTLAQEKVELLLKAEPDFVPAPGDPRLFGEMVDEEKREARRRAQGEWWQLWKGNSTAKWIATGVLVGGAAVGVTLLLQKSEPQKPPLPGHPGEPN